MKFVFFGTPDIATIVLDELELAGFIPSLVVTNPDAQVGRKQILTPSQVKIWATNRSIPVITPATLKNPDDLSLITDTSWDLFIVAAYGKLIPAWLIDLPTHKTLNVHPSLLPKLRGASPIRSAILENIRETGVTIMQLDAELDHGPIIAQLPAKIAPEYWPVAGSILDVGLAHQGGALLASIIPAWLAGDLTPTPQRHDEATLCTKITKDMSQLMIDPIRLPTGHEAYQTLLKIRAFSGWPETFFIHQGKRIKIKHASLTADGTLLITRIVPEGKNEMDWDHYFK